MSQGWCAHMSGLFAQHWATGLDVPGDYRKSCPDFAETRIAAYREEYSSW
jgi:hypothetical protein